ncbi:uncharacterized protein LOC100372087 [Saccoglossus kowalevskii]|uniref:Trichohyalin-like n=1 Tax=Saccoglossus kowalevskii TaxID=10224 RepID=A0ABM0MN07_SACKO|nr:PREDICTED: trichohyalin-like [Saccoglossus kowalevskii]
MLPILNKKMKKLQLAVLVEKHVAGQLKERNKIHCKKMKLILLRLHSAANNMNQIRKLSHIHQRLPTRVGIPENQNQSQNLNQNHEEPEEPEPEPEPQIEPQFADEPEPEFEPEPVPEPARLSRKIEEPTPVDEKPKLRKVPTIEKTEDESGSHGSEAIHQLEEIREKRLREEEERMEQQMERRRLERERQERELEELRERKEQRKREQEEREMKRRQEEAQRKAREEEEAAKRRADMERRKEEAKEKRRHMMNGGRQPVMKLDIRANISRAKQESSKEIEEKAREKERVLKERVPALNTEYASVQRLQELAMEYNEQLRQVLTNVYDLNQRDKRQQYDITELSQRLKEITAKASVKKIGLGVETQKVTRFMDKMGTQQEQEGSKGEQRRFSRFKERNEGIAASGGVAGRLSMFQQQAQQNEINTTPRRGGGGSKVWKPPVGDKCKICNKTVYAMEKLEADCKLFHKLCFRCETCKRAINLANFAVLDDKYYCKPHQRKIIRERGQDGQAEVNHTENHTNGDEEP